MMKGIARAAGAILGLVGAPSAPAVAQSEGPVIHVDASKGVFSFETLPEDAPVGVAELSTRRVHVKGAVGMAHPGDPAKADSQVYITLADRPDLDGQYVVFGQLVAGEDVVASLQVGDLITRAAVAQ